MAKRKPFDVPAYGARTLSTLSGVPETECAELVKAVYARRPVLKWGPPIACPIAFLGWMFLFGRVTDVLEKTRWDVLALPGGALLGYPIAITLALVVATVVPRAVLRRALRHCLYSPACFWCGYSLRGLEIHESRIRCPECGKFSPAV
ncbi:MAG: hypothetical protein ACYSTY_09390 [Planctomycetota bacterium]|jgi:peptidoglycan/LPS O-acetylase OafA/YrhL